MASVKLIQERPVSLPELKEKLDSIETRNKQLTFRGNKVRDYVNKLVKLDSKKADELKKKIESLEIPRIKDRQIIKIIDILPESMDDLKAVFIGETTTITQDNMEKIAEAVKPYLSRRKK